MNRLKHPSKLIILFILSGANAVYHIITSIMKYDTLEVDVSQTMSNILKNMPDINPADIPDFIFKDISNAISHYIDYGVVHYYAEFWSHAIALLGVLFMASFRKAGFGIYVIGQIVGFSAIFIGYGFNLCIMIGAVIYAVLAFIFIRLYQNWFLKSNAFSED